MADTPKPAEHAWNISRAALSEAAHQLYLRANPVEQLSALRQLPGALELQYRKARTGPLPMTPVAAGVHALSETLNPLAHARQASEQADRAKRAGDSAGYARAKVRELASLTDAAFLVRAAAGRGRPAAGGEKAAPLLKPEATNPMPRPRMSEARSSPGGGGARSGGGGGVRRLSDKEVSAALEEMKKIEVGHRGRTDSYPPRHRELHEMVRQEMKIRGQEQIAGMRDARMKQGDKPGGDGGGKAPDTLRSPEWQGSQKARGVPEPSPVQADGPRTKRGVGPEDPGPRTERGVGPTDQGPKTLRSPEAKGSGETARQQVGDRKVDALADTQRAPREHPRPKEKSPSPRQSGQSSPEGPSTKRGTGANDGVPTKRGLGGTAEAAYQRRPESRPTDRPRKIRPPKAEKSTPPPTPSPEKRIPRPKR